MRSVLARLADEARIDGYGYTSNLTEVAQCNRDVETKPVDALRAPASEVLALALFIVPAQLGEIYLSRYDHV